MYTNQQVKNYDTIPEPGNPTQTEAWALTQAALKMKAAKESGDTDEMLLAARLNWRLWTIFQADLLGANCTVPEEIRVNMLTLARYVDQVSLTFMGKPNPDVLDGLININREIAGGLYDAQKNAPAPAPQQPQAPQAQATSQDNVNEEQGQAPQAPVQGLGDIEV